MISGIAYRNHKYIASFFLVLSSFQLLLPLQAAAIGWSGGGGIAPAPVPVRMVEQPGKLPVSSRAVLPQPSPVAADPQQLILQNGHLQQEADDIDGPSQPEMTQFKPIGASNMVDLFSGDFSYNIPLLDVGGYPINISYTGNISMDQESSWVGLGWNINPGSITRNMRGLPDDFNGKDSIEKTVRMKPQTVIGGSLGFTPEMAGLPINLNFNLGASYNSKTGWGTELGVNPSVNLALANKGSQTGGTNIKDTFTMGLSLGLSSQEGISISPSFDYLNHTADDRIKGHTSISTNYNSRSGLGSLTIGGGYVKKEERTETQKATSNRAIRMSEFHYPTTTISFSRPAVAPTISMPYTTANYNFTIAPGLALMVAHGKVNVNGYYSRSRIDPDDQIQRRAAYGYLHFSKATSQRNNAALLDFNRDKEALYRDNPVVQNIAVPSFTYDAFSINGEGSGGMFRAYRGDVGYSFDPYMRTKSQAFSGGLDLGLGKDAKWGGNFAYANTTVTNQSWNELNAVKNRIPFTDQQDFYEPVYFRNPGEMTVNNEAFYNKIGNDHLVKFSIGKSYNAIFLRPLLDIYKGGTPVSDLALSGVVKSDSREKRTQVISYLTADEASRAGMDTITSYPLNTFPQGCGIIGEKIPRVDAIVHRSHHISLVNVLNKDGRRYEYGIPAYNIENREVSYSLKKEKTLDRFSNRVISNASVEYDPYTNQAVGFKPDDESDRGTDQFFNRQVTPAYSHSFLLTGIYTPDYVDVTGDGISDDDLGDAVKMNYSRVYSQVDPYCWRTPFNVYNKTQACFRFGFFPVCFPLTQHSMAGNYEEGLKTDYRDDKASYIAGSKEIWYLNSVESKTMVATFKVSVRQDACSQENELGGNLAAKQLYRLDEINLYARADVAKNTLARATPIKTVHFEYDYSLCKRFPLNMATQATGLYEQSGKLTLKKIWFTYNRNNREKKNPYLFSYRNNKDYADQASDNWGNYKDPADNPGGLLNKDYPYPVNTATAGKEGNVAPWMLDQVVLPSGSRIRVSYEADDYAYVQNKRAQQLFQVVAMGRTPDYTTANNQLYEGADDDKDHRYIFVKVPAPVASKAELFRKYLSGLEYLYFRVFVQMPEDPAFDLARNRYEYVKLYTKLDGDNYGIVPSTPGQNIIYFKIKGTRKKSSTDGGYSPIAKAAIQFLRNELPAKAFPGSQFPADEPLNIKNFATALISAFGDIKNMSLGFHTASKIKGVCKIFDTERSFVRLNSPEYRKTGGGYRVRRVEITDNWNAMTGQKEATYGQEYIYNKPERINGRNVLISSGVASYEPMLGGEENPFRLPIENFDEQTTPLGPINTIYTEGPLLESFYPAATVGYSRVLVKSIHSKDVKSAIGWDETKFYTSYDYPVLADYTPLTDGFKKYTSPLRALLKINTSKIRAFSQGFRVELNDMNGKMRSQASYAQNDSIHPITYTEYFYRSQQVNAEIRKPDNTAQTIDRWGNVQTGRIGEDIEVMSDFREQRSFMFSGGFNTNFHFFTLGIIPILLPAFLKMPQSDQTLYRAAAITKVINRHALLDSVVSIDKGSRVSTRNLAYDAETGDVLVTRTNNEFDDPVYNVSIPAHWAYDRMGGAYQNIGVNIEASGMNNGVLANTGMEQYFVPGDEVLVTNTSGSGKGKLLWVVKTEDYNSNPAYVNPALQYRGPVYGGLVFVDREGYLYNNNASIRIQVIRSGRRNTGSAAAGSVTLLSNPIVGNKLQLFNGANVAGLKVIDASVAVFREDWKVKERFWRFDTSFNTVMNQTTVFNPSKSLLLKRYYKQDFRKSGGLIKRCRQINNPAQETSVLNGPGFVASFSQVNLPPCDSRNEIFEHRTVRSIIDFDLSAIPAGATINSATLELTARPPVDIWNTWSDRTTAHRRLPNNLSNQSGLYIVRKPWNQSTLFSATQNNFYLPGSRINVAASGSDCINYHSGNGNAINCLTYVQDKLANPVQNFGMLLRIDNEYSQFGKNASEEKTLSFCTRDLSSYTSSATNIPTYTGVRNILGRMMYRTGGMDIAASQPQNSCASCNFPQLQVAYSYISRNTQTECRSMLYQRPVNPYTQGILGNYRSAGTYTYYTDRKEDLAAPTQIRKDGTIRTFEPFWVMQDNPSRNPGIWMQQNSVSQSDWVLSSENTLFDEKGSGIETRDPLNRYTAGLYGYRNSLPMAVVQNSKYREMAYDGFEDYGYRTLNCRGYCDTVVKRHFDWTAYQGKMVTDASHSGKYSLRLSGAESAVSYAALTDVAADAAYIWLGKQATGIRTGASTRLPVLQPTYGSSMVVSAWVKESLPCPNGYYLNATIELRFRKNDQSLSTPIVLRPTGLIIEGWQRVEAVVTIPAAASGYTTMLLTLASTQPGNTVYFDDLRLHPYHANMKSFVYDPVSLRLMAELDENNYASFYEYDDDGTLIRTKKETERGIKTINETRSALQKLDQ